jgi:hypothetical protein
VIYQANHVGFNSNAIGISANWLWNFFVAMIGPTLITDLEWKGYLIFMCMNLAFLPVRFHISPSLHRAFHPPHLNLHPLYYFLHEDAMKERMKN